MSRSYLLRAALLSSHLPNWRHKVFTPHLPTTITTSKTMVPSMINGSAAATAANNTCAARA